MRSALELFVAADKLQHQNDEDVRELQKEILQQYKIAAQNNSYDDFMRILISIERIAEHTKQQESLFHSFSYEFLSCDTTKQFVPPQIDSKKSTFTIALLSTIHNFISKLNSEFYINNENIWSKDGFFSLLLFSVQIPPFFDTIKEDAIYNKSGSKESLNKAKVFVPQVEKVWKIISSILQCVGQILSKDFYPQLILSMGEYSAQYKGSWTSPSIIQSIAEIKSYIDQLGSSSSSLFGDYILQIISRVSKFTNNISWEGASWCLKQVNYPDLTLHPKMIQFCLSMIENDFAIKQIGFSSLSHIIQNVNSAELIHYQEPIYSLLSTCITSRELIVLSPSLPLMIIFLQSCNKITTLSSSILDSLFSTFLLGLNNTNPSISEVYICNLPQLLDLAGVHVVIKFAAVLFPYLEAMLQVDRVALYDMASLLALIKCLQRLVACSWPRVPVYRIAIFRSVVSCLVGRPKCEDPVVELAADIMGMLKTCCKDNFKDFDPLFESLEKISPQITTRLQLA